MGVSGGTCGYTAQQGLFSIGFSNGAAFALRLGCQAAHLHRAIAAGSGWISPAAARACNPTRNLSFIGAAGTQDSLEARLAGWSLWRRLARCKNSSLPSATITTQTVRCFAAGELIGTASVVWVPGEIMGSPKM